MPLSLFLWLLQNCNCYLNFPAASLPDGDCFLWQRVPVKKRKHRFDFGRISCSPTLLAWWTWFTGSYLTAWHFDWKKSLKLWTRYGCQCVEGAYCSETGSREEYHNPHGEAPIWNWTRACSRRIPWIWKSSTCPWILYTFSRYGSCPYQIRAS